MNCTKVTSANIINNCDEESALVVVAVVGEFRVILKLRTQYVYIHIVQNTNVQVYIYDNFQV